MLSRSIRLFSKSSRVFSTVKNVEAASTAFNDIVSSRVSCRSYKNRDVSDEVLNRILSLTLSAPTARNWQPYKIVIVKDKTSLAKMSTWMPKKNADVINQVPGVAVFLADTEPALMVDDLKGLWKSQGMDDSKVPSFITEFTKTCGKDGMTKQLAKCGLKQTSNKGWAMEYYTNREWSIKQSVFPMELFVLGCQANGLSSIVMEGFDGRHIRDLVGFSKRYFVTGLVPFGYAKDEVVKPTLRYSPESMVFDEKNGVPRKGIVPLKRDWRVCSTDRSDGVVIVLERVVWCGVNEVRQVVVVVLLFLLFFQHRIHRRVPVKHSLSPPSFHRRFLLRRAVKPFQQLLHFFSCRVSSAHLLHLQHDLFHRLLLSFQQKGRIGPGGHWKDQRKECVSQGRVV